MLTKLHSDRNNNLNNIKRMMRTRHRTISPKIQTNFRIPAVTRFVFAAFVLKPLGGCGVPPWTDVGLPCGTLGLFFLTCWKIE